MAFVSQLAPTLAHSGVTSGRKQAHHDRICGNLLNFRKVLSDGWSLSIKQAILSFPGLAHARPRGWIPLRGINSSRKYLKMKMSVFVNFIFVRNAGAERLFHQRWQRALAQKNGLLTFWESKNINGYKLVKRHFMQHVKLSYECGLLYFTVICLNVKPWSVSVLSCKHLKFSLHHNDSSFFWWNQGNSFPTQTLAPGRPGQPGSSTACF